jgi:hypothetical protein
MHQTGVSSFLENLTELVNLFLSGKALPSFATFMSSASLVPLLKKDGHSIRPIAVGEILRRLVSKCCVRAVMLTAAQLLQPLQVGVGVPNGAEAVIHALNRYIRRPDLPNDTVVALVDFANAFNRVDRQKVLDEIFSKFPTIFGWVQYTYGVSATLFTGTDILMASAGVQQGDPLGPLLFALVFQPILLHIRSEFSLTSVAFLDDWTLAGPAPQVAAALQMIREIGPESGLFASDVKTVVWSPSGQDLQATGLFDRYQCPQSDGVELLGGAVSVSSAFIVEVASKRVDKCVSSLHRMLALEDPQLCLMLLRACEGMPKLMYTWRTIHPQYLHEPAMHFEDELIAALRRILVADGPHFGDFQVRLSTLPVSLGGLGIQLPSDILHFAFSASAIASFDLQQSILGIDDRIVPNPILGLVHAFTLHVYPDAPEQASQLSSTILSPHDNLQLFMARILFDSERLRLLHHSYITNKDDSTRRRFLGILESTTTKLASAWLFALPNGGLCQRMTPLEFMAAICLRLLMPQFALGSTCHQKSCGVPMDIYGYHSMICNGHLLGRHNLVRDALFDIMMKARFNPVKDAQVTCLGLRHGQLTNFRPADLLVSGDDFEKDCIDITVVSPIITNHQPVIVVGAKAESAERLKYQKHQAACEQAGLGFKAFAIDVFGVPAKESLKVLHRICSRMMREGDYPEHMATAICFRRVSFAVQLGVARLFIASRAISS